MVNTPPVKQSKKDTEELCLPTEPKKPEQELPVLKQPVEPQETGQPKEKHAGTKPEKTLSTSAEKTSRDRRKRRWEPGTEHHVTDSQLHPKKQAGEAQRLDKPPAEISPGPINNEQLVNTITRIRGRLLNTGGTACSCSCGMFFPSKTKLKKHIVTCVQHSKCFLSRCYVIASARTQENIAHFRDKHKLGENRDGNWACPIAFCECVCFLMNDLQNHLQVEHGMNEGNSQKWANMVYNYVDSHPSEPVPRDSQEPVFMEHAAMARQEHATMARQEVDEGKLINIHFQGRGQY